MALQFWLVAWCINYHVHYVSLLYIFSEACTVNGKLDILICTFCILHRLTSSDCTDAKTPLDFTVGCPTPMPSLG